MPILEHTAVHSRNALPLFSQVISPAVGMAFRGYLRLALLLLGSLSLAGCLSVPQRQSEQCGAPSAPQTWTSEAWEDAHRSLQNDLTVVFVLDPNFVLCWEVVEIDAFTNATLLPWVRELKDTLTVGQRGGGQDLLVRSPRRSIGRLATIPLQCWLPAQIEHMTELISPSVCPCHMLMPAGAAKAIGAAADVCTGPRGLQQLS